MARVMPAARKFFPAARSLAETLKLSAFYAGFRELEGAV
jgi:hypothetical protein